MRNQRCVPSACSITTPVAPRISSRFFTLISALDPANSASILRPPNSIVCLPWSSTTPTTRPPIICISAPSAITSSKKSATELRLPIVPSLLTSRSIGLDSNFSSKRPSSSSSFFIFAASLGCSFSSPSLYSTLSSSIVRLSQLRLNASDRVGARRAAVSVSWATFSNFSRADRPEGDISLPM